MSTMRPIRSIALTLVTGLALLMAAVMAIPAQPAAASAAPPLPVPLGTHSFGHLRVPNAIVAQADPDEVGWESPPPGADGVSFGPWSFDIARDGSIWLLDEVNERLLVWQPGQPDRPARTVPLPFKAAGDLALGADGTIHVTSMPAGGSGDYLYALTSTGQVRWKTLLPEQRTVGSLLIVDDMVYFHFTRWTPMTDTHGQPLPAAEQRRLANPHQPLSGGLRLSEKLITPHELRLSLIDKAGQTVRGWQITSKTELGSIAAKAALVHDDLVATPCVSEQTKTKFLYECLVLRLPPIGGTSVRFAVAPESRVMWGSEHITGLRVGPDGQLYQLRSDRATGVSIARYSLAPTKPTPPTSTTPGGAVPPSTVAPPPATSTPAPTLTAPTTPPEQLPTAPQVQPRRASRSVLPWVMAVVVPTLLAVVICGWLWHRRRHSAGPQRHERPRPAH
jgi:hypothetical protein